MKQLVLAAPKRLEWHEVPTPQLADAGAALVRPIAVAVCDFDRALVSGTLTSLPYPIAVGHEIVAEVVELGTEVRCVERGDRVIVPLQVSCGRCACCGAGRTNSCSSRPAL